MPLFNPASNSFASGILTDTIAERTASAGVTVASLLLKSGNIVLPWTTWTPTFTAVSPTTITASSCTFARYLQLGKLVVVQSRCSLTFGGTTQQELTLALPVAPVTTAGYIQLGHFSHNDGVTAAGIGVIEINPNNICNLRKRDFTNWGIGSAINFFIDAVYEAA